ncbi:MAG: isochorismatase family protein, partial [Candidatus Micrarchaeaceae archaeon]
LAFDYCVQATAIDAAKAGFKTTVIREATASVSLTQDEPITAILRERGIVVR